MQTAHLSGSSSNCSSWRCKIPSDSFNKAGGKWKGKLVHVSGYLDYLSPIIQDIVGPADIVLFQRNIINESVWNAIEYWLGMGKPTAVDLDDAYSILPWSNPAKNFWHHRPDLWQGEMVEGAAIRYLEEGLRRTGALISPNRNLLNDWSHVCRGYYLQNYAETAWWVNLPSRQDLKAQRGLTDRIVIGWGGSVSHYDSFWGSGIREAAERVCKRHPEVLWLICGNDGRIHDQLPVPFDQKAQQAGVPPEEWPKTVKLFDIGVAPLWGVYDQRRSWIKGIEYSLAGVPWVGTDGEVYRDIADTGALVPGGVDAWEAALEYKINNLKREQEVMEARIPEAQQRFLVDNNLDVFEKVYRQIIADFNGDRVRLPGVVRVAPLPQAEPIKEATGEAQPVAV
jgi:hypothetical protein